MFSGDNPKHILIACKLIDNVHAWQNGWNFIVSIITFFLQFVRVLVTQDKVLWMPYCLFCWQKKSVRKFSHVVIINVVKGLELKGVHYSRVIYKKDKTRTILERTLLISCHPLSLVHIKCNTYILVCVCQNYTWPFVLLDFFVFLHHFSLFWVSILTLFHANETVQLNCLINILKVRRRFMNQMFFKLIIHFKLLCGPLSFEHHHVFPICQHTLRELNSSLTNITNHKYHRFCHVLIWSLTFLQWRDK